MKKLAELRTNLGLSQKDIAEQLGLGRSTYAQYENGTREPDYKTLKNMSAYFHVSTDYLLSDEVSFVGQKNSVVAYLGEDAEISFRQNDIPLTPEQLEIMQKLYKGFRESNKK